MNLVVKDAFRQIAGRVASAIGGFLVVKMITPYLGPLRFGDYSTILKYFAIRSAFADFGLYVIGLKMLGSIKRKEPSLLLEEGPEGGELTAMYGKIVGTRLMMICIIYTLAIIVAYLIPAYTDNPYLTRGLPFGMLFSASFMLAGILQTPLQLFRKMKQVSIALILARVSQIAVLAGVIYIGRTQVDFSSPTGNTLPFLGILASVLISGIIQGWYVFVRSNKYLPLQITRDWKFTKAFLHDNRQYGIAYYLSSFHTLIVLILLSIFYPTIEGYTYAGTWALGLSLIEILLIVPSALGNSLIHSTAHEGVETQREKFGNLAMLVIWIGCFVTVMFKWFGTPVISFLGGVKYLGTETHRGSDTILPFLGIVITLSFAKQVGNYLFVATGMHNKLLWTNGLGVVIGLLVGIPALLHRQLFGGVITQLTLEAGFLMGAIWIAWRYDLLPRLSLIQLLTIVVVTVLCRIMAPFVIRRRADSLLGRLNQAITITAFLTLISFPWIRHWVRGLH